jgi:dihydrofolate synthase/folylpolyglutamate synthase
MSAHAGSGYASVAEYLFGLKPKGKKLGIDRMRPFAAELGQPERAVPVVHVAGTNGKGSVSAMIEAVLRGAGWRVGLFTSPHLVHMGERVQVNRVALSDAEIVDNVRELDAAADRVATREGAENRPSFFEFMTAMALLQFSRMRCDVAVIEVGLGGEFDATNIVMPEVSVITSIGLDHCEWLGDTIEKIAEAKAGIVKRGVPVVIGRVPEAAERVIRRVAAERQARVVSVREEFGDEIERYPRTNLEGDYQRWNAGTAALALRELGLRWRVTSERIQAGLNEVTWPGRWERRRIGGRDVVLDASHNPEGAAVLETNLARLVKETEKKPIVVLGVLGAERARALVAAVCRYAKAIWLVVPEQPRASGYAELEALVPAEFSGRLVRSSVETIFPRGDVCAIGDADDVVVVTGSIYLIGEVMARLARR